MARRGLGRSRLLFRPVAHKELHRRAVLLLLLLLHREVVGCVLGFIFPVIAPTTAVAAAIHLRRGDTEFRPTTTR